MFMVMVVGSIESVNIFSIGLKLLCERSREQFFKLFNNSSVQRFPRKSNVCDSPTIGLTVNQFVMPAVVLA